MFDDNQEYLHGRLILEGKLIYRDFHSFFPPFADYHTSLTLLFTENILILRYIHSFIFAFLPPLIFLLGRYISKSAPLSFLAALLIIFGPNRPDKYFLFTFLLLSFLLVFQALRSERYKYVFLTLSGCLYSIILLFRYDLTVYYVIASCFLVLMHNFQKRENFRNFLLSSAKYLVVLLLPVVLVIGILLFWSFINNNLNNLIQSIVIVAIGSNYHSSVNLLTLGNLFPSEISPQSVNSAFEGWLYIYILSIAGLLIYFLFKTFKIKKIEDRVAGAMIVPFLLAIPYILPRMDTGHLFKGSMSILVLLPFVLSRSGKVLRKWFVFITILVLFAFIARSYNWTKFNDSYVDFKRKGSVFMNSSYTQASTRISSDTYLKAVDFLSSSRQQYVFAAPYMGSLYYFSDKNPPVKYSNLLVGYTEAGAEDYIIEGIESKDVERIIYDPDGGPNRDIGGAKIIYPKLNSYLLSNFEISFKSREGWLFLLKPN